MKKTILMIALMACTTLAFSQIKETAKHVRTQKQAKPYLDSIIKLNKQGASLDEMSAKLDSTLTLTKQQAYALYYVLDVAKEGISKTVSPKITPAAANEAIQEAITLQQVIAQRYAKKELKK